MRTYLQNIGGGKNEDTERFSVHGVLQFSGKDVLIRMTNAGDHVLSMTLYFSIIGGPDKLSSSVHHRLDANERPPRGKVDVSRFYRETKAKEILGEEFYIQLIVDELYHQSHASCSEKNPGWTDF